MTAITAITAITPTPIPTTKALVPAASSPIAFPAPASDADFNTVPTATATGTGTSVVVATGTGTSTGTTSLTVSAVTNTIVTGAAVGGAGVPCTITGQTSGTTGGAGVYTTSVATTVTAGALTFTPPASTNLAVSAVTGSVQPGMIVTGTGVPAGVIIQRQTSGPMGGAGNYTTNIATSLSAVALTFTQQMPIDPGGNKPPTIVFPATVIPGEPLSKTGGNNPYTNNATVANFIPMPISGAKNIFNQSAHPPFAAGAGPYPPTPPPTLP
jgi:hypothetical protein